MTKPFVMGELLARLRAKLRREEGNLVLAGPPRVVDRTLARRPGLIPDNWPGISPGLEDPGRRSTDAHRMGDPRAAAAAPGPARRHDAAGDRRVGPRLPARANCLHFHLVQLRRKLKDNPARPRHLLTEHGMGYRYLP